MLQVPRYFLVLSFLCPIYTSSISQAFGQGEAEGRSIGISDSGRLGTHGTKIDNRCASSATVKLPLPTMAGKRQNGDAVYRPAAAPATLLQVQNGCPVVQPSLYGVRYMDYIPVDNLAGPTPCVTRSLNQNVGGLTYLGDASSYSPTNYRIQQSDLLTIYPYSAVPQPVPVPLHGKTVNFHTPSFAGFNPLPRITLAQFQEPDPFSMTATPGTLLNPTYPWEYGCNGVLENLWCFSDTSNVTGSAYSAPNIGHVEFMGIANDLLEPKVGGINWDLNVNITPGTNSVTVTGWHTCYPAHQITINGIKIYSYQPAQNTTLYLSSYLLAANFRNLNPGNVQVNCTLQLNAATPCRIGPPQPAIVSQSVALAGFRQTTGTKQNIDGSTEFDRFFAMVAAETPSTAPMTQAAFHKLSESIQTMSPATLSAGISVIDEQLDSPYSPATRNAKIYAGILINMVSFRPDFMDFLVPEIPRLSALVLGPVQTMSPMALNALQSIGYQKPELVVPVFIAALKAKSGQAIGPVAAATLLRIAPPTDEEVKVIADFMRRPDLPAKAQIDTIIWITSSPAIPDPIAAELIHFLDSPEESVRNRALVAISKSSPPVQDRARARLTQMINDAHETSRTKRIANEALRGEVQSDPESEK